LAGGGSHWESLIPLTKTRAPIIFTSMFYPMWSKTQFFDKGIQSFYNIVFQPFGHG
jgi:hypothetical protein